MSPPNEKQQHVSPLAGRKILLGISGGIAAYKSAYLTRLLKKDGADVWVCMTKAATKFITPLTMETLSEREVLRALFPKHRTVGTRHITIAQWADALVIAPATANIIAKMRGGIADDMLTTLLLSTTAPVFIAPAMNTEMYNNPATVENMATLRERGVHLLAPGDGELACGTCGVGRMAEPEEIIEALRSFFQKTNDFAGRKILITAGPTHEAIDPVRFLSNRSSGRMGYRLAEAAADRGAQVVLISGPTNLADPVGGGVETIRIQTAAEMKTAVEKHFSSVDAVIMAAAVADFRPVKTAPQKIKKSTAPKVLELTPTVDILQKLGQQKTRQILVGFALETANLANEAQRKLIDKNLDLIVANDPNLPGAGFEVETNIALIIDREGQTTETGKISKRELAELILDRILLRWSAPQSQKD